MEERCDNCAYYDVVYGTCINSDSEYCADFILEYDCCDCWIPANLEPGEGSDNG